MEINLVNEPSSSDSFKEFLIPGFAVIISLIAVLISIYLNKRTSKKEVLKDILDEYRSEKMGLYLVRLWKFYHKDPESLDKRYLTEDDSKPESIHLTRRYISLYFQQVAAYYYEGYISKRDLKKFWSQWSISIIKEVIVPIEYLVISKKIDFKNNPMPKNIEMMVNLYNDLSNDDKIDLNELKSA